MKRRTLPDVAYLRSRFIYSGETGLLVWKPVPPIGRYAKVFNTRWAGTEAGAINVYGYKALGLNGVDYYVHRIMWKLVTGEEPPQNLDHINRNTLDNRFCNLRPATDAQNSANAGTRKRSKTGHAGVFRTRNGTYAVTLSFENQSYWGGCFQSLEEAVSARRKLAEQIHGEFAGHLNGLSKQAARLVAA